MVAQLALTAMAADALSSALFLVLTYQTSPSFCDQHADAMHVPSRTDGHANAPVHVHV